MTTMKSLVALKIKNLSKTLILTCYVLKSKLTVHKNVFEYIQQKNSTLIKIYKKKKKLEIRNHIYKFRLPRIELKFWFFLHFT